MIHNFLKRINLDTAEQIFKAISNDDSKCMRFMEKLAAYNPALAADLILKSTIDDNRCVKKTRVDAPDIKSTYVNAKNIDDWRLTLMLGGVIAAGSNVDGAVYAVVHYLFKQNMTDESVENEVLNFINNNDNGNKIAEFVFKASQVMDDNISLYQDTIERGKPISYREPKRDNVKLIYKAGTLLMYSNKVHVLDIDVFKQELPSMVSALNSFLKKREHIDIHALLRRQRSIIELLGY